MTAGPIERVLQRIPGISQVAVYGVPDDRVGDAVMAAIVLDDDTSIDPDDFAAALAAQPDLSPKAWPRYVRIAKTLPTTATNKIVKRQLKSEGAVPGDGTLWVRPARAHTYHVSTATPAPA